MPTSKTPQRNIRVDFAAQDTRFARSGRSNPQPAPFILGIPESSVFEQSATRSFYLLRTEKAITFDDILPIIREALEKAFRTS